MTHTNFSCPGLPGSPKAVANEGVRQANRCRRDAGAIAVWTLGVVLLAYVAVGVLVDIGSALTAKTATLDVAQQAARAGAGQLDLTALRQSGVLRLDPAAARAAATSFLDQQGLTGTVTATPATVQVTAVTRHPTVLLRITGVTSIDLSATATAQPSTQ